jgi:hypothetical protein
MINHRSDRKYQADMYKTTAIANMSGFVFLLTVDLYASVNTKEWI